MWSNQPKFAYATGLNETSRLRSNNDGIDGLRNGGNATQPLSLAITLTRLFQQFSHERKAACFLLSIRQVQT